MQSITPSTHPSGTIYHEYLSDGDMPADEPPVSYWNNQEYVPRAPLSSPEGIAETQQLFTSDHLLVRAMDEQRPNGTHETWDREIAYMSDIGGMRSASCTLLVPGEHVATYKPYGMLLDANCVETLHISATDSNSKGDLNNTADRAGYTGDNAGFGTINELAVHIRSTRSREMNEINANIPLHAIRGLFAIDAPTQIPLLNALVTQRHIAQTTSMELLPIFRYQRELGMLEQYQPTPEEVEVLIAGYRQGSTSRSTELIRHHFRTSILGEPSPIDS